jgi:hypothetical protein
MANIDDVVTVQKNGVIALNALTAALENFRAIYQSFVGTQTFLGANEDALVYVGPGRLVNVVVTAAAAGGTIHDVDNVADANAGNVIFPIPSTIGITQVNIPFVNGLVIKPAATSMVNLTYSEA